MHSKANKFNISKYLKSCVLTRRATTVKRATFSSVPNMKSTFQINHLNYCFYIGHCVCTQGIPWFTKLIKQYKNCNKALNVLGFQEPWSQVSQSRAQLTQAEVMPCMYPLLITKCSTSLISQIWRKNSHQSAVLVIKNDWQAARLIQPSQSCINPPELFLGPGSGPPRSWAHVASRCGFWDGCGRARAWLCEVKPSAQTQWLEHWHSHIPHVCPSLERACSCLGAETVDSKRDDCWPSSSPDRCELRKCTSFQSTNKMSCITQVTLSTLDL